MIKRYNYTGGNMTDAATETTRQIHLIIKKLSIERSQAKSDLERREYDGTIKGLKMAVQVFIDRQTLINLRGSVSQ